MRAVAATVRVEEGEKRLVHLPGILVPVGRIPRHRRRQDRDELRWDVRAEKLHGGILPGLNAAERLERRRGAERVHRGDRLVEDDPEGEEVAPRVHVVAARLLGAHVAEFPLELAARRIRERILFDRAARFRDAEVGDFHLPLEAQEDVLRAHVAVDDVEGAQLFVATPVRVVEPLGDLRRDVDAHVDWERDVTATNASEERREIEAVHVLHRHVVGADRLLPLLGRRVPERSDAEVEDLDDVRVRQADRELGFVDEHLHELLALREVGEDPFDDDDLLEPLDAVALRLEDLGHSPATEALEEAVATERGRHVTPPSVFECHVATRTVPREKCWSRH